MQDDFVAEKVESVEVKIQKVVESPKISLKQFSRYTVSTERGKNSILQKCKYPGEYIPKFYEMARKLICELFAGNFEDTALYFDEFKKQALIWREQAKSYEENRDGFKNRVYSANGLDKICMMSQLLSKILDNYVLDNNLRKRRDSITKNGVRVGAMADMLVSNQEGARQVGFLKFNFTSKVLTKSEADIMLYTLKLFFEKKGIKLLPNACFVVDVYAARIYTLSSTPAIEENIDKATLEIRKNWDLI